MNTDRKNKDPKILRPLNAPMTSKQVLDWIRNHSSELLVNVAGQGMCRADFLEDCGIRVKRMRVRKGRIIYVDRETGSESPEKGSP